MTSSQSMICTVVPEPTGPIKLVGQADFKIHTFAKENSTVDEIVKAIKYNGMARVKGFLTPEEVEKHLAQIRPTVEKMKYPNSNDTTKRLARLPLHQPELTERILTDDLYLGISDALLSKEYVSWLGENRFVSRADPVTMMTTLFAVGPGTRKQELHRDDGIYMNEFAAIKPEEYNVGRDVGISCFIAATKTTVQNGATNVVPGSHLTAHDDQPDPRTTVPAELDTGDAFFMLSSCYHGAGHNASDKERLVWAYFMMRPEMRQEENLYLALPLDVVKKYPRSVQKRLGYDIAPVNLGWVDHTSPMKSILGYADGDQREIPGYESNTQELEVEVMV